MPHVTSQSKIPATATLTTYPPVVDTPAIMSDLRVQHNGACPLTHRKDALITYLTRVMLPPRSPNPPQHADWGVTWNWSRFAMAAFTRLRLDEFRGRECRWAPQEHICKKKKTRVRIEFEFRLTQNIYSPILDRPKLNSPKLNY